MEKENKLKNTEKSLNTIIKNKLADLASQQQKDLSITIRKDVENENMLKFELMKAELEKRSGIVRDYNKLLADNEKLKLEKDEAISNLDLEVSKKLNIVLADEKLKIQNKVESEFELRIKQLQKQLKDQKVLTDEQQRKLNQGSIQLQGEAQEEVIEEWLRARFPMDEIEEIKKGANGADCLQHVHNKGVENCGRIYYESKNTKKFNNKWIEKFKLDMQEKNADIGVIVSKTLPVELKRMGLYKGIYVCTLIELKSLVPFIRDFLIQFAKQKAVVNNMGDKKSILYKYLNSKEFKLRLESFSDTFSKMNDQLEDEIKKSTIFFQKRKGALEVLQNNVFSITGRFSGIMGTPLNEDDENILDQENSFNLLRLFEKSPEDFDC